MHQSQGPTNLDSLMSNLAAYKPTLDKKQVCTVLGAQQLQGSDVHATNKYLSLSAVMACVAKLIWKCQHHKCQIFDPKAEKLIISIFAHVWCICTIFMFF